jgi:hypothetical protein
MLIKIIHIISLFVIETFFQLVYYTVLTRYYFMPEWSKSLWESFKDAAYVVGSVKAAFFLPVYLLFYLVGPKSLRAGLSVAVAQGILFFVLTTLAFIILPANLFQIFLDIIFLAGIAFLVAFLYSKIFSFPNPLARK